MRLRSRVGRAAPGGDARRPVARQRIAARPRHRAGAARAAAPQLRARARGAEAHLQRARQLRAERVADESVHAARRRSRRDCRGRRARPRARRRPDLGAAAASARSARRRSTASPTRSRWKGGGAARCAGCSSHEADRVRGDVFGERAARARRRPPGRFRRVGHVDAGGPGVRLFALDAARPLADAVGTAAARADRLGAWPT